VWRVALKRNDSGLVESVWNKSLCLRKGLLLLFQGLQERFPWCAQGGTFFPIYVIGMELNLCYFTNDGFHEFGILGQNTGALKLHVVTWLICTEPWPIFPHDKAWCAGGGLNKMPCLFSVYLTTLTGDAVSAHYFQTEVFLDGLKETGDPPRWEAYTCCCSWRFVQERTRGQLMLDPA